MRDGAWKLVRPSVPSIKLLREDMELYKRAAYDPGSVNDILRKPLPYPDDPKPLPAMLFNLSYDPSEQTDLSGRHPQRAERMLSRLEAWFADVETERTTIRDT